MFGRRSDPGHAVIVTYTESSGAGIGPITPSEDKTMAIIVIKDLPENFDLDREAMQAITGGARLRGRTGVQARAMARGNRNARRAGESRNTAPQGARRCPVMSTLFRDD